DTAEHDLAGWANADDVIESEEMDTSGDYTAEEFDKKFNARGSEHHQHRHVFRSFVWNEDGALSPLAATIPDLADFGLADADGNWLRRPRPVGRTFLYDEGDALTGTYPAKVQMAIDDPNDESRTWIDIPAKPLPDRAGFRIVRAILSGDKDIETWHPWADARGQADSGNLISEDYGAYSFLTLLYNTLDSAGDPKIRIRLIGSVESDEHVLGQAQRELSRSGWPYPAQRVVRAADRFARRDVMTDPWSLGAGRQDTRDDSAAAASYAATLRDGYQHTLAHGSIVLRGISRSYRPGDAVEQTWPRRVGLAAGDDANDDRPIIAGVTYDFREGACRTELALDTDTPAEQVEYLQTVKESADSLLAIVNDILDFSKIEAG
ncbi:hypothetical protein LCGC14_2942590, partial [marine sediment metagenome]